MARANSGDSKYLELWFEELIYFEKSVFFFRTILPLGDFFCETRRSYSGTSNSNILA